MRVRVLFGIVLAPAFVSSAIAADLPSRKAAAVPAPVFTWTGFYVGINGGFGGGLVTTKQALVSPPGSLFGPEDQTINARLPFGDFFAGGQIGFNYQFANRIVIGVESDMQASALKLKASAAYDHQFNAPGGGSFENYLVGQGRFGQDWYGTTRARIGYALTDRFLAYVTGGVAYSKFASTLYWTTGATAGVGPTSITGGGGSGIKVGGTVGAGVEYALTQNLTFKTEYLYMRYAGLTTPFQIAHVPAFGNSSAGPLAQDAGGIHVIRAGLNWKFGDYGLPVEAALTPPLFASASPVMSWTGFYVGVNAGYGGGLLEAQTRQFQDAGGGVSELQSINTRLGFGNFFGGLQAGYNYQFANNVVVGIETDFQGSAIKLQGSARYTDAGGGSTNALSGMADFGQDWFGTTRLRLGYAFGGVMPYVTGGLAYSGLAGKFNYSTFTLGFGTTSATTGAGSEAKIGFAAGAGLEYAISPNWSVKTEYLYTHYSSLTFGGSGFLNTTGIGPEAVRVRGHDLGISVVRAGLNYRFDPGTSPVVARY